VRLRGKQWRCRQRVSLPVTSLWQNRQLAASGREGRKSASGAKYQNRNQFGRIGKRAQMVENASGGLPASQPQSIQQQRSTDALRSTPRRLEGTRQVRWDHDEARMRHAGGRSRQRLTGRHVEHRRSVAALTIMSRRRIADELRSLRGPRLIPAPIVPAGRLI